MLNSLPMPAPPRNGLAIISELVGASCGLSTSGRACTPCSSLRSALASASGSPVIWAPLASAWYSRLRLIASWMIVAAIGPTIMNSSAPKMPGPSSSSLRPIPPKIIAICAMWARKVMTVARVAATELMRMSRLPTWASSWPRTPRSSRSSSSRRMPSVAQTAACRGLRPVANALGASVGLT